MEPQGDLAARAEKMKNQKLKDLQNEYQYMEAKNYQIGVDIECLGTFDEMAEQMENLTPDGGIKKLVTGNMNIIRKISC